MQVGMLLLIIFSLAMFSFATLAQQDLTEILLSYPACSAECSAKYLPIANCGLSDLRNCMCTNDTLQYQIGACVLSSCNVSDQITKVIPVSTTITQTEICNGVPQPWQGDRSVRASIIIAVFTFPIVALRFITRIHITKKLWWDDWAILLATVFIVPNTILPMYLSHHGFGTHFYDVPPANIPMLEKLFYVANIFYVLVQNIPKFSILLLYLRIFPTPEFRRKPYAALTWQACHTLGFLFAVAFQCVPVPSFWDPFITDKRCVNLPVLAYMGAGFSIFEDIVIMLLPIYELKGLNLGLRKRIALILMSALGSFACLISMIRLKFVIGYGTRIDSTWFNVDVVIWSEIETYTAVICACLMCIRPLILKYTPSLFPSTKNSQTTPSSSRHLHTNSSEAKVSSWIRAERASRYSERLSDEEDIEGRNVAGEDNKGGVMERSGQGKGGGDGKGQIRVTTECMVEYEMQRVASRRAESEVSTIGELMETGSKENLNDRFVLAI
ncbi:uncharacterized protein PAC_12887 [Phialocephala subalpina]|uniref:Uncharacterized protein n=1 Tax=Phialocephala subalpina TaxID=576137 RepID=A0A1L7XD69_9HELO|nr:uncharacterized protein PAC_12887 [Phialocephala subalpina]